MAMIYLADGAPLVQGDLLCQQLYFVDFDLGVPPCCLHAMPILPDLQLPKQNKANIVATKSKATKYSRQPDGSICMYAGLPGWRVLLS